MKLSKIGFSKRCSTFAEAAAQERKMFHIWGYGSIGGLGASFLLGLIPALSGFSIIISFLTVAFFLLDSQDWGHAKVEKTRLADISCPHCQTRYNLASDVTFEFRDIEAETDASHKSVTTTTLFKRYAFFCKCPKCGESKVFSQRFACRKGTAYSTGSGNCCGVDENKEIEKYFSL